MPRALHQLRQTPLPAAFARSFEHEPQAFLDQMLKLAAAQRRRRLGSPEKLIGYFDGGLHCAGRPIKPQSNICGMEVGDSNRRSPG